MNIYSRARKHIDMNRVKELKEEKYIADLEKQREIVLAEITRLLKEKNKHYDWRTGKNLIEEGMTTSALGMVNLEAEPDVDIINTDTTYDNINSSLSQNVSRSGTTITLQGSENQIVDGVNTAYNIARFEVDATRVSHVKITIQKGGGATSWTDRIPQETFTDAVTLNISDVDNFFAPIYNDPNLSSGTHLIRLPGNYKNLRISFEQFAKVAAEGSPETTGALTISNVSLQRLIPINLVVPLDDPEANSFMRDGQSDNLSPEEKKKKLEEQLKSSEEYLNKMYGEGMPKGATEIADVQPQQSFMDIQVGDQRITKQDGRTITDTTRGIKDGKMDGRSTYTDSQGNLRVSQPKPQPKDGWEGAVSPEYAEKLKRMMAGQDEPQDNRTSITNVPTTTTYTPYTDAEKLEKDFSTNPNLLGRGIRSATDQARFAGDKMFQGNPAGRAPGLSNYWSPDPATAGTYSNPGAGKGVPGAKPNPTGTITTAPRPPGTPRVTRSPLGQPQFKFPTGSPSPGNMLTQMADDAAVSAGKKAAATTASKTLGRAVPVVSIGIAVADATVRASNGDYAGAVLSGMSAVPGPIGWAGLGVQIATDAAGFTGGVKEQQEFDNYGDYIKDAGKIAKKNKIKIDRNAMLDLFLRELSKNNKLSDKDKEFLVAIFTDAEGLEKDDVITFVKKIQKKLTNGKSIKEQVFSEKKRIKSPKDLYEGMTTAALGMINLNPADGDLQSNSVGASDAYFQSSNATFSGSAATYDFSGSASVGNTYSRSGYFAQTDATQFDTFVTNVTVGSGPSTWNEPREGTPTHTFPGGFRVVMYSKSKEADFSSYVSTELSSGTNRITIPSQLRVSDLVVYYIGWANSDPLNGGVTGNHVVSSASFQRVRPMSVFVGLDDPEANAFIRDGQLSNLSPEERKKRIEKMLKSSNKYMNIKIGEVIPKTATQIADYELQQSFGDIALDTIPYEEPSPGPGGYKRPGSYDPNKFYDLKNEPSQLPSPNLPSTGPGRSSIPDGTQVAQAGPGYRPIPGSDAGDSKGGSGRVPMGSPAPKMKYDPHMKMMVPNIPRAQKTQRTMVAHHKPQGETIMEKNKKSFSDLTKKIPGYYDGKPAPLGFPIVEPPKMKNGMHPDLVDGKKTAKRFNRLDPVSAKAMPKTGNPHIDKKVQAAAKKPK